MKILFYTSVLSGGGAERVLCQLANFFSKKNDVFLVASYKSQNEYSISSKVNKIYLVDDTMTQNRIVQLARLRKLIRLEGIDICVSFLPQANYKMLIATMGLQVKKIISVRNDPSREYEGLISKLAYHLLYPMANGVVFQTPDARDWFGKRYRNKSRIIMNPIEKKFFDYNWTDGDYYVAVGRLNEQKNYNMMVRGFSEFVKAGHNSILRIYGEGPQRNTITQLIEDLGMRDHITLMGSTVSVAEVLSNSKAFIMTSSYEGMPNSLLEALAVGVPVICTDCPCGGPRTVITDEVNGYLISMGNITQLKERLIVIDSDCVKRKSFSLNAKKRIMDFFPEIVLSQWEKYICDILGV